MRTLRFEPLESRQMMAVTASLNNGTLEIRAADTAANDIAIVGTGVAGEVSITGRNGTTVNGLPSDTITGVTGSIDVKLRSAPPQTVTVDNLYIAGFIYMEAHTAIVGGNGPVSSGQFMWLISGGVVQVTNTHVNGSLVISSSGSVSVVGVSALWHVEIAAAQAILSQVNANGQFQLTGNNLAILTSSTGEYLHVVTRSTSQTTVYVDSCFVAKHVTIDGNARFIEWDDSYGPVSVSVFRCQTRQLAIYTARSDDHIDLYANFLTGPPYSFGEFDIKPPQSLYINSRAGNDFVELRFNVVLDNLFAGLGSGDDTMTLTGNSIRNAAYLDGDAADYPAQTFGVNRLNLFGNQLGALATPNWRAA